ncbi:hypothetical protein [Klenkia sp. PcliD-1-E]|uniref:hypothetical protein n=1 Tax=Klenkia sp. PcliD-1-E TaxID=2954492 RepID=UPI002096EB15|nr:hypothetical protein [Klenkia sp. PcliD-1-E]MCO7220235.1 hypothetical protein [Klenkia sp. PcliD-1-E]
MEDNRTAPGPGLRHVAGWALVVLLALLITVLTIVLAGMVLVVSVWLTVAVPLVVLLAVVGVAAHARRG